MVISGYSIYVTGSKQLLGLAHAKRCWRCRGVSSGPLNGRLACRPFSRSLRRTVAELIRGLCFPGVSLFQTTNNMSDRPQPGQPRVTTDQQVKLQGCPNHNICATPSVYLINTASGKSFMLTSPNSYSTVCIRNTETGFVRKQHRMSTVCTGHHYHGYGTLRRALLRGVEQYAPESYSKHYSFNVSPLCDHH
jgi:hypothetical protein